MKKFYWLMFLGLLLLTLLCGCEIELCSISPVLFGLRHIDTRMVPEELRPDEVCVPLAWVQDEEGWHRAYGPYHRYDESWGCQGSFYNAESAEVFHWKRDMPDVPATAPVTEAEAECLAMIEGVAEDGIACEIRAGNSDPEPDACQIDLALVE